MWWSSPSIFRCISPVFEIIITSLPLPFLPSAPFHISLLALFKFMDSFSLIVAMCIGECLCMYTNDYICHTYIHSPNYILLSLLMLFVCMFSGLAIWYWITNWCVLPWGRLLLPESVLIAYGSLYRIEAHHLSPIHIGKLRHCDLWLSKLACLLLSLFSSCLGSHVGEILWM